MKTARFLDVAPVEGRKASVYGSVLRRRMKLTRNGEMAPTDHSIKRYGSSFQRIISETPCVYMWKTFRARRHWNISLQKDDEKATTIRCNSEKSHATPKPQPRARQSRPVIVEETQQTNQHCYKGLLDFSQRLKRIKSLTQWNTKTLEDKVVLKKMADHYVWYMCGKRCLFDNVSM